MSEHGISYPIKVDLEGDGFNQLRDGVATANESVKGLSGTLSSLGSFLVFSQLNNALSGVQDILASIIQPGLDLDAALKDLGDNSGLSADTLDVLATNAREMAKVFGVDASDGIKVTSIVLSDLNKDLAKTPDLLKGVTATSLLLSKHLDGDAEAAVTAVSKAMSDFGLKTGDATKDASAFAVVANHIAASADLGGVKIDKVKEGLEAVGDSAKDAKISLAETLASLQVLGKNGMNGEKGGTAFAGVASSITDLSPDASNALRGAGIDTTALADGTRPLAERLEVLKPLLNDTAALTKIFGEDNVSAAQSLISQTDNLDKLTVGIENNKSGLEKYTDDNISLFDLIAAKGKSTFSDLGITVNKALTPLKPLGSGLMSVVSTVGSLGFGIMGLSSLMETGFLPAIWESVTGAGAAAVAFLSNAGATIAATLATWGFNAALLANPIGLVIAGLLAVGAAVAAVIYWWDDIKGYLIDFAVFVAKLNPFYFLYQVVDELFPEMGKAIRETFGKLVEWLTEIWDKIKGIWDGIKNALKGKLKADIAIHPETQSAVNQGTNPSDGDPSPAKADTLSKGLSSVGGAGGNQVRNVTVNIQEFGKTCITYDQLKNNPRNIKAEWDELLISVIRDAEIALA